MPELHETRMGQKFFEHTMPELVNQLKRLADAEEKRMKHLPELFAEWATKENIFKYASEEELFCIFHTFAHYWNQVTGHPYSGDGAPLVDDQEFTPTDNQIGEVIKELKENYK